MSLDGERSAEQSVRTTRVLVDEFVCAGGFAEGDVPDSLAREGRAMREALRTEFAQLEHVSVVAIVDGSAASFFERLEKSIAGCDAALVVAPEFDGILERTHEVVSSAGVRWIGCNALATALCSDKLQTHNWLVENGFPTVPTRPFTDSAHHDGAGTAPWILKPRDGAGSLGIRIVEDAAELDRLGRIGDVIQPFLPGVPISIAALLRSGFDFDLLLPARQRLDPATLAYRGGILPLEGDVARRVESVARRVIETLPGLQGYIGIDLLLPDANPAEPLVIEINPRVTTSYLGYRELSHGNLAARMLGPVNVPLSFRDGIVEFGADGRIESKLAEPTQ